MLFQPRAKMCSQKPNAEGTNKSPALDNHSGIGRCVSILQAKSPRLNMAAFALLGDTGQGTSPRKKGSAFVYGRPARSTNVFGNLEVSRISLRWFCREANIALQCAEGLWAGRQAGKSLKTNNWESVVDKLSLCPSL